MTAVCCITAIHDCHHVIISSCQSRLTDETILVRAGGGFITAKNTSYSMKGLVLLSSGGQFCYAYDKMSDLVGSEIWKTCTYAKQFGCCPSNLTVSSTMCHDPCCCCCLVCVRLEACGDGNQLRDSFER